jgi:hypothetical protein
MNDTSTYPDDDDPVAEEGDRVHAQDPAEGADPDADDGADVPRVHPEDPAEG